MRHIVSAVAISAALAFGGCSTVESIESNLASPTTTQAASNVETVANAVECFVSGLSGAAAAGLKAGNAKGQTATAVVYTISSALCITKFGGAVGAPVAVPAASVVTQ